MRTRSGRAATRPTSTPDLRTHGCRSTSGDSSTSLGVDRSAHLGLSRLAPMSGSGAWLRPIGVSVARLLVLLVALAGLFAMHGLSDHGVGGAAGHLMGEDRAGGVTMLGGGSGSSGNGA